LGAVPPLGPPPEYPGSSPRQAPACCRQRLCLLKGCERPFHPLHPLARYCGEACRQAARRWAQWRANKRYRTSDQGRCHRREQSSRRRIRAGERRCPESADQNPREGYHKAAAAAECCCSRPGCYQRFTRSSGLHCRISAVSRAAELYVVCSSGSRAGCVAESHRVTGSAGEGFGQVLKPPILKAPFAAA
jgi:hypothetical protein